MTSNDHKMTSNDLKVNSKHSNENEKPVFKKVRTKNNSRGGDLNDDNPSHGKILIEQAFSSK